MSENGKGVTLLELKQFFIKRNVPVKVAREVAFRFVDYLENNYPNAEDGCQFNGAAQYMKNGNGNGNGRKNGNAYKGLLVRVQR